MDIKFSLAPRTTPSKKVPPDSVNSVKDKKFQRRNLETSLSMSPKNGLMARK